jgi:hypothetical protein
MKILVAGAILSVAISPRTEVVSGDLLRPESTAAQLGVSDDLAAELCGLVANCTSCNPVPGANSFPRNISFGNCSDTGGPMTSSLTEAMACVIVSGSCAVSGTVTFTPGCIICCSTGSASCQWLSMDAIGSGSSVEVRNTPGSSGFFNWHNCTAGAINVSGGASCASGSVNIEVIARIIDCATNFVWISNSPCLPANPTNTQLAATKKFLCQ